jgi:ABC-type glycerol-3-phosphate transport system permease component
MLKKLTIPAYLITRLIVIIGLIIIIFPLFWIFTLSLKLPHEVFEAHLLIIPKHITYENYLNALDYAKMYFKIGFPRMYLNSFFITSSTIILTLFMALLAGFALSNFHFKGKGTVFSLILSSFMIPTQVLLIPLFVFFKKIHILNTYLAVVFPYTLFTVPISVLIFRSFFSEIPLELKEAAIIDGASQFSYFLKVALPIAKPAIATCIIYSFTLVWNEFLLALVFLGKDKLKPLPVAISNIAGGQYIVPYNIFTASMMICIIPVLIMFLWLQKWFLRGVTMGALKG